jgi:ABC-type nitrate/sulfonate/bicarbonate transport system permease component
MRIKNVLRDIYVNMVLYTNSLYTYWELLIAFGIGVVLGSYLLY